MVLSLSLLRCPDAVTKLLHATERNIIESRGIKPTRLYTHTADVDTTNQKELEALTTQSRTYTACDSSDTMKRNIDTLCPAPYSLVLKIGAQV